MVLKMLFNLINITKKDLKVIVRHRGAIFASMCLPFLLYGIFDFIFSGMMHREADITPLRVAVVDKEKSTMSRALINNFKDNKSFSGMVNLESVNYDEAQKRFKEGELTGIIVIPENFSKSLMYIENYPIEVSLNEREPLKSGVLKNMMESYGVYVSSVEKSVVAFVKYLQNYNFTQAQLDSINEKMSLDLTLTALSRGDIFEEKQLQSIPAATSAEYFIMAILVLLLMYNGVTSGNYLIKDLNSGCLRRTSSAVSAAFIVVGKWLAFSLFGIVQAIIFILPISYFAELFKGFFLRDMIIYMSIAILFITSIFIFISTFFSKEAVFMTGGNVFVFICGLAGGSFLPLQLMPMQIQKLAALTPNYWIIKGSLYIVNYMPLSSIDNLIASFLTISLVLISTASIRLSKAVKE